MKFLTIATIALSSLMTTHTFATENESFFGEKESIEIKFGGWSHHDSSEESNMSVRLNENHLGLGIEYYRNVYDTNHFLGAGLWYMTDSFDNPSYQASIAYKYKWQINKIIDSIDFNINVGVVNRSYREMKYVRKLDWNGNVLSREFIGYEESRDTRIATMPFITLNFTEHLHADVTYLPEALSDSIGASYSLFFMRLGYTF